MHELKPSAYLVCYREQGQVTSAVFIFLSLFLITPQYAYAYVDPGAGSYSLQIIIAFLVTGIFAVKLVFKKVKIIFLNLVSRIRKNPRDK